MVMVILKLLGIIWLPHGPHNLLIIGTVKHASYEGYVVLASIRITVNDQNIMYTTN